MGPPMKRYQACRNQFSCQTLVALSLLLLSSFSKSEASGLTVIMADTPSAFASPDPNDPKYIVTLRPSVVPGAAAADAEADLFAPAAAALWGSSPAARAGAGTTRVTMTAVNGRRYSCALPGTAGGGTAVTAATGEQGESGTLVAAAGQPQQHAAPATDPSEAPGGTAPGDKTPEQLLEAMTALCLYRQEGLWTYEVCYKKRARQFRQDNNGVRAEDFSCGEYDGDERQDLAIQMDSSSTPYPIRYVSHTFGGGEKCVMTGESRTAEVRFTCLPDTADNAIVSIKEFPTCNYVFVVTTPFLCRHPAFKPKPESSFTITCEPMDDPVQLDTAADQVPLSEEDTAESI